MNGTSQDKAKRVNGRMGLHVSLDTSIWRWIALPQGALPETLLQYSLFRRATMEAKRNDLPTPNHARREPTREEKLAFVEALIREDAQQEPRLYATESEVPAGGE